VVEQKLDREIRARIPDFIKTDVVKIMADYPPGHSNIDQDS